MDGKWIYIEMTDEFRGKNIATTEQVLRLYIVKPA